MTLANGPQLRSDEVPPSQFQTLGLLLSFAATVKDAPQIMRLTGLPKILAHETILAFIARLGVGHDTVLFWFYIAIFWCLLKLLKTRSPISARNMNNDSYDFKAELVAGITRLRRLRIVRSLGLVLLREWILGRLNVLSYGTFKRPTYSGWAAEPQRSDYIDRITFTKGDGVEYQYLKDFSKIVVRIHPADSEVYQEPDLRLVSWKDAKLLFFASNVFLFWLFMHLIRRLLSYLKVWRIT